MISVKYFLWVFNEDIWEHLVTGIRQKGTDKLQWGHFFPMAFQCHNNVRAFPKRLKLGHKSLISFSLHHFLDLVNSCYFDFTFSFLKQGCTCLIEFSGRPLIDRWGRHRHMDLRVHQNLKESCGRCIRFYSIMLLEISPSKLVRTVNDGNFLSYKLFYPLSLVSVWENTEGCWTPSYE